MLRFKAFRVSANPIEPLTVLVLFFFAVLADASSAKADPSEAERWGILSSLVGHSWQMSDGRLVSFAWGARRDSIAESDWRHKHLGSWRISGDRNVTRYDPDGVKTRFQLTADGSLEPADTGRGRERVIITRLGEVLQLLYQERDGSGWRSNRRADITAWKITADQSETIRTWFGKQGYSISTAQDLVKYLRGSTAFSFFQASELRNEGIVGREFILDSVTMQSDNDELNVGRLRAYDFLSTAKPRTRPKPLARMALVVGISQYTNLPVLTNATSDARLMSTKLQQLGFATTHVNNPSQSAFRSEIQKFGEAVAKSTEPVAAVFFFAGHGMQYEGKNYLIPADSNVKNKSDVEIFGISADLILSQLALSSAKVNVMILDACRTDSLPSRYRGGNGGFVAMSAPSNSFIAYSTAPGAVADDGESSNSPFAQALAAEIDKEGQPIESTFRNVRRAVLDATKGAQTPWDSSSLIDEFSFAGGVKPPERAELRPKSAVTTR